MTALNKSSNHSGDLKKFEEIVKILDKHKIEHYIDMSTLLGAVEESLYKLNVKKIYISLVHKCDVHKIYTVISEIRKKGYKVSITTLMNSKIKDEIWLDADLYDIQGVTIDQSINIIFKHDDNDRLSWVLGAKVHSTPKKNLDSGFNEIKIYHLTCKIPKLYDQYLGSLYGDWKEYGLLSVKKLKPCTIKDKLSKIIRIKTHEGARFKYHCNKVMALKILRITINALNKHNVAYYLDFGTLIGAMREKGFIDWDDDVDISLVDENDYYKMEQVSYEIRKKGLSVMRAPLGVSADNRKKQAKLDSSIETYIDEIDFTDKYNTRIFRITGHNNVEKKLNKLFYKLGLKKLPGKSLDIFFKYKKDDQLVWMAQYKAHNIPIQKLSKDLIEINFYNLKCTILKNYDEYLTSMYGDWKTPKKDWQYYEEDMVTRG